MVAQRSPTEYEQRVYRACSLVPSGRVTTYGTLSELLHSAPRAVGQALKRNPFAPDVPCHRVITSTHEIGGFQGSWGASEDKVQIKRAILGKEGPQFNDAGKLISKPSVVMGLSDFKDVGSL